ncbi:MAG: DNA polymerase domain-containing protein [Nanoarchaeota archaeon]
MQGWLIDAYWFKGRVILWTKHNQQNIRTERRYTPILYADTDIIPYLTTDYALIEKKTYMHTRKRVCRFAVNSTRQIHDLERRTRHRIPLYNADMAFPIMYMLDAGLTPFTDIEGQHEADVDLTRCHLEAGCHGDPRGEATIDRLTINDRPIHGDELHLLHTLAQHFHETDPDIILMDDAFIFIPLLAERARHYGIRLPFHRWDPTPIFYRGGKTFYSYGQVAYRDFPIRLHGRLLLDTKGTMGSTCDVDAILELCQLSGGLFQQTASRSFGAVFQQALVKELYRDGCLIPHKEKPIDRPLSMLEMVKADRAGHRFDAKVGLHKDVAEIDFSSMFPYLIKNFNISAETLLDLKGPFRAVPGVPVRISHRWQGYVARAVTPFLEKRMEYKRNPTSRNLRRASGLKWILVSSYGYLRFREFKLGIPSAHMAIGAFAREIIIRAARLAEQRGFTVIHGIVDSLYLKKAGMTRDEVEDFCKELQAYTGIPMALEGIFDWIVFLPSVNDIHRPLPARYYGQFDHGGMKVRGIEMRRRDTPRLVKDFQRKVMGHMSEHGIDLDAACRMIRETISLLPRFSEKILSLSIRLTKTEYKKNIAQRTLVESLRSKGQEPLPGQTLQYIRTRAGPVLVEDYQGDPDEYFYERLLIRALFVLYQPFGISKDDIRKRCLPLRQKTLSEYPVVHRYFPIGKHKTRSGLSERRLKARLQRMGWEVWRGGLFHVMRHGALFPNVEKKYHKLFDLMDHHHPGVRPKLEYLSAVHKGMPDFIAFRNGQFLFVECKLGHEQLSNRQRFCIKRLQELGFVVEVHKLVDECTKSCTAKIDLHTKEKRVEEKQMRLKLHW